MPFINFYTAKPAVKLLIVLLSIVTIGIIVFFIGLLLGRVIFWMHLDEVNHILYQRFDLVTNWQLKYFQLIQTIGFFLIPGFFIYWILSTSKEQYFEARKKPSLQIVILVFLVFIVGMPFMNWIIAINQNIELPASLGDFETRVQTMEETYAGLTERLLTGSNIWHLLFNLILISVIPAIGEEFIFRGVLQQIFKEITRNVHVSILITALIFSAIHGQFYGFVPRFLLGIFFGYLMVWGRTIWLPVIAHFMNNAFAVIAYYMVSKGAISADNIIEGQSSLVVLLTSFCLLTLTLIFLWKVSKKELVR